MCTSEIYLEACDEIIYFRSAACTISNVYEASLAWLVLQLRQLGSTTFLVVCTMPSKEVGQTVIGIHVYRGTHTDSRNVAMQVSDVRMPECIHV
jgi:hypothetical protein